MTASGPNQPPAISCGSTTVDRSATMPTKILRSVGKALSLLVFLAVSLVLLVIVYSAIVYPMYLESLAKIGTDKNEVLTNLEGKNYNLSDTFSWCEKGVWYGDCDSVANSNSVEFLTLKIGIDNWLVVGFNSEGKVSFVGRGDT